MRHYKKGRKLGTDASHTKAMKKSLVQALFTNDRIKTIEARAKEIRPDVDRIITWAKRGDLHSQGMWADRQGGYTRIMKLGTRKGDNASMVIMELVTEPVKKAEKKAEAVKAAPKKVEEAKAEETVEEPKAEEAVEAEAATEEKAE